MWRNDLLVKLLGWGAAAGLVLSGWVISTEEQVFNLWDNDTKTTANAVVLLVCALIGLFLRSRMGIGMTASGESPTYARSIGIPVERM